MPYKKGERPIGLDGRPHNCGDKGDSKAYDPWNGDREKEARCHAEFQKATFYCEYCKKQIRFIYPCDHHLPDGYKYKSRRAEVSRKIKESMTTKDAIIEETTDQEELF